MLSNNGKLLKRPALILSAVAVFLLLLPGFAAAQKTGKPLVDSLLAQLQVARRDTGVCKLYNDLSIAQSNRDPIAAYAYADKLMALAKKISYKKGKAMAYYCYGSIYIFHPDYPLALENFRKCEQLALQDNNLPLLALTYLEIGKCYDEQQIYAPALDNYKKAVEINIRINQPVGLQNTLNLLYLVYNASNKDQEGIDYYNSLLKTLHDNILRAYIIISQGDIASEQKKWDDVFKYETAATALISAEKSIAARDYVSFNMAQYYLRGPKDTVKGIEYLQRSADLYASVKDPLEARRLTWIGSIYEAQKKYDKALGYFQRASALGEKYETDDEISALNSTANLYRVEKKDDEVIKYEQKAVDAANRLGNKSWAEIYTGTMGYTYQSQHKYPEALKYFKISVDLDHHMQFFRREAYHLSDIALVEVKLKEYNTALTSLQKEVEMAGRYKDKPAMADAYIYSAMIYRQTHNYTDAIKYQLEAEKNYPASQFVSFAYADLFISQVYDQMHNNDRSLEYAQKALDDANKITAETASAYYQVRSLGFIANSEYKLKRYSDAMRHVQQSIAKGRGIDNSTANEGNAATILGLIIRDAPDSVLINHGIDPIKRFTVARDHIMKGYNLNKNNDMSLEDQTDYWRDLSITYEKLKQYDQAYDAYQNYVKFKDSADVESDQTNFRQNVAQFNYKHNEDSIKFQQDLTAAKLKQQTLLLTQQNQSLTINQQQLALAKRQKDLQQLNFLKSQADLEANRNKLKASQKEQALAQTTLLLQTSELSSKRTQSRYFIGGIVVLLLLCFFVGLNYANQRKANRVILSANEQAAIQKAAAENNLAELKAAQNQLVQSEKMASLGELTAGIAHEIQNPLNFVNNFSEVNKEMFDELEEELKNGNIEEALAIAANIKQNEEKIHHHGKRADFIVKGMLQHSRTNTGERQPTNINTLADEFFKLSYHGLRAKDKNFNAGLVTNFDKALPNVNLVQQDVGRVLLNLFNNAFYAVSDKRKTAGKDYEPKVAVATHFIVATKGGSGAEVTISVRDNGNGIPQKILDKIYQPFFTTKPTGQGTGLGLSLSYDIIKAHGGSITVDTKEGAYTEFTVRLPA